MSNLFVVEMERDCGSRYWSRPMPESEVDAYISKMESLGDHFSDCDVAGGSRYVCPNSLMKAL